MEDRKRAFGALIGQFVDVHLLSKRDDGSPVRVIGHVREANDTFVVIEDSIRQRHSVAYNAIERWKETQPVDTNVLTERQRKR